MIIKSTEMRIIIIDDLKQKIQPGNNEVDAELWKKAITKYNLQPMIDSGKLVEVQEKMEVKDKEGKSKKKISNEFPGLSNKKKRDVVENTYNIEALKNWRTKESDADIRNLIDDQIKAIKDHKIETPAEKPGSHV